MSATETQALIERLLVLRATSRVGRCLHEDDMQECERCSRWEDYRTQLMEHDELLLQLAGEAALLRECSAGTLNELDDERYREENRGIFKTEQPLVAAVLAAIDREYDRGDRWHITRPGIPKVVGIVLSVLRTFERPWRDAALIKCRRERNALREVRDIIMEFRDAFFSVVNHTNLGASLLQQSADRLLVALEKANTPGQDDPVA